jgi:RNA polymerase sigma factor (sigma-70 family)
MRVETMACPPGAEVGVIAEAGEALSAFYRAEYPRLVGSLTLYCGDRELATELAQEAMARAWRLWSRVGALESPAGWVHRVGINLANSAYQRARVRRRFHAAEQTRRHDHVAAPADVGTALALRAAVASLPPRQRSALVLRYFVDLPVDEVARYMRCKPGTVRALTAQAINSLRAMGVGEWEVTS